MAAAPPVGNFLAYVCAKFERKVNKQIHSFLNILWYLTKHINCISGMYGEECRTGSAECNQDMPCIDGKCVCKSGHKNYNYTPQYTYGFMLSKCIRNDSRYFHPNILILTTNREEISS